MLASIIRPQFFFFALHGEHGHAVGELVAFDAEVGGDVADGQNFFNAPEDRVTVLDNLQVLDLAARYTSLPTVELLVFGVSVGYQLDQIAIGVTHVQTRPGPLGA